MMSFVCRYPLTRDEYGDFLLRATKGGRSRQLVSSVTPKDSFLSAMETKFEIAGAPAGCEAALATVLSAECVQFLTAIAAESRDDIASLYRKRRLLQAQVENDAPLEFRADTSHIRSGQWVVDPLPQSALDRRVDIGDIPPSDGSRLFEALYCGASGVQIDFDDGSCPTWRNVLLGHLNVYNACRDILPPHFAAATSRRERGLLMVRPRAWNMQEKHCRVGGEPLPGGFFDFAVHMFHNAKLLHRAGVGPYFYLPKVESYEDALVWDRIITRVESRLGLPFGCTKVCILIENISGAFQMEEILHAIRHHAIGLNAGVWDYSASFAARLGDRPEFLFPDRGQHVTFAAPFINNYARLLIHLCHKRGALATTGMAPQATPDLVRRHGMRGSGQELGAVDAVTSKIVSAKRAEAQAGSNGALVFDPVFAPAVKACFQVVRPDPQRVSDLHISSDDLLTLPRGDVTQKGVEQNISISIRFIYSWLHGEGTFVHNGAAEDSATAEISRTQVWQWLKFACTVADTGKKVDVAMVEQYARQVCEALVRQSLLAGIRGDGTRAVEDLSALQQRAEMSVRLFMDVVTARFSPTFITTYLYDNVAYWHAVQADHQPGPFEEYNGLRSRL